MLWEADLSGDAGRRPADPTTRAAKPPSHSLVGPTRCCGRPIYRAMQAAGLPIPPLARRSRPPTAWLAPPGVVGGRFIGRCRPQGLPVMAPGILNPGRTTPASQPSYSNVVPSGKCRHRCVSAVCAAALAIACASAGLSSSRSRERCHSPGSSPASNPLTPCSTISV